MMIYIPRWAAGPLCVIFGIAGFFSTFSNSAASASYIAVSILMSIFFLVIGCLSIYMMHIRPHTQRRQK